ncbi:hypothetical protein QN219_01055 [Sinorhizobium sp. 7-81]|uniref:hypothetical protein n=1 Tax=Sinorhizobium sp. 8-89 TaxID=3049089 RepID=UPI0024C2A952|nr:hypothetical protein [Sinorhizobium sp. 8-89]MDK1488652.1 hypothetical protein [Sinorhizobium sp. 8-89]
MRRRSYTIEQIDLPERVSVVWRYSDMQRKWNIYVIAPDSEGIICGTHGVNNKLLEAWSKVGPGTEEFSRAVGNVTVDAVELVNHRRALKAGQTGLSVVK